MEDYKRMNRSTVRVRAVREVDVIFFGKPKTGPGDVLPQEQQEEKKKKKKEEEEMSRSLSVMPMKSP
eukprot:scaffold651_cov174-Ochromonas_danica.AAC.5